MAGLAALAQNTQDPMQRTRLFQSFDDFDDPSTKVPLVQGLQDPNPLVREEAADALSRHAADPTVRREAMQALQERRR